MPEVSQPHCDLDGLESQLRARLAQPGVRAQLAIKRLIDILGSLILIIIASPVLLLTALAVRLTSRGPILYRHLRWGQRERHFVCLKFRSMRVDQARVLDPKFVQATQASGKLVKLKNDPRLTIIGGFLRRTSIDELPQLFNVLKGDMSLVGPRPLVLPMLEPYPSIRSVRCLVRPGITGLWQVRERHNNTSVLGMMPHDIEYLHSFTLWLDCRVLFATLPAVAHGDGAF